MELKALRGLAVITVGDGQKIGEVAELYIDPSERRIVRLRIASGGFFGGRKMQVPLSAVQQIGQDAVLLPNADVLEAEPNEQAIRDLLDFDAFTRLRVVSDHGRLLGTVSGGEFDPADGRLTVIAYLPTGLRSLFGRQILVAISDVITLGKDVVVVPEAVVHPESAQAEDEQSAEHTG